MNENKSLCDASKSKTAKITEKMILNNEKICKNTKNDIEKIETILRKKVRNFTKNQKN